MNRKITDFFNTWFVEEFLGHISNEAFEEFYNSDNETFDKFYNSKWLSVVPPSHIKPLEEEIKKVLDKWADDYGYQPNF